MSKFAVVIECTIDGQRTIFVLDSVNEPSTSISSNVTSQPVSSGDVVADHIYREPITQTLRGTFARNGSVSIMYQTQSFEGDVEAVIDSKDSISTPLNDLLKVQRLFERINFDGILCDITKMEIDGSDSKFETRKNMVLHNIEWTEGINTLGFSFSFKEVIMISDVDYDNATVEPDDYNPNITEPKTTSVADVIGVSDAVIKEMIYKFALDVKWVTEAFMNHYRTGSSGGSNTLLTSADQNLIDQLKSSGVGSAIATLGATSMLAIGAAILEGVANAVNSARFKLKPYKYDKNSKKQEKEEQRFSEEVDGLVKILQTAFTDNMTAFQVTTDEDQEVFLTVDDEIYVLTFNSYVGIEGGTTSLDDFKKLLADNNIKYSNIEVRDAYIYVTNPKPQRKFETLMITDKYEYTGYYDGESQITSNHIFRVDANLKDVKTYRCVPTTVDGTQIGNICENIMALPTTLFDLNSGVNMLFESNQHKEVYLIKLYGKSTSLTSVTILVTAVKPETITEVILAKFKEALFDE